MCVETMKMESRYKSTLESFVRTTSIKGVSKVVSSPSPLQKLLWALGALFGFVFGTYVLTSLAQDYFNYDSVVSIGEKMTGAQFPDVTMCNLNPMPPDEILPGASLTLSQYFTRLKNLTDKHPIDQIYFDTLNTPNGYLQQIEENQRENDKTSFVSKCTWSASRDERVPCTLNRGYIIQRGTVDYHSCVTFHTNYTSPNVKFPIYGLATVLYLHDFTNSNLHNIDVNVHLTYGRGVKVLIHPPDSLPLISLYGMKLPPGQETTISIKTTERIWLGEPYGKCTDREYLDEEEKIVYTKRTCGEFYYQQLIIEHCQCLAFNMMATRKQRQRYPYCGKLYDDITKTIANLQCFERAYGSKQDALGLLCPVPCKEFRYTTDVHSVPWPHEAYQLEYYKRYINKTNRQPHFKVYEDIAQQMQQDKHAAFERLKVTDVLRRNFLQINVLAEEAELVRNVKENPAMTVFALIGTIGGACNLWMGVTFLTVIELLDLLYQLCLDCRKGKPEVEPEQVKMEETPMTRDGVPP